LLFRWRLRCYVFFCVTTLFHGCSLRLPYIRIARRFALCYAFWIDTFTLPFATCRLVAIPRFVPFTLTLHVRTLHTFGFTFLLLQVTTFTIRYRGYVLLRAFALLLLPVSPFPTRDYRILYGYVPHTRYLYVDVLALRLPLPVTQRCCLPFTVCYVVVAFVTLPVPTPDVCRYLRSFIRFCCGTADYLFYVTCSCTVYVVYAARYGCCLCDTYVTCTLRRLYHLGFTFAVTLVYCLPHVLPRYFYVRLRSRTPFYLFCLVYVCAFTFTCGYVYVAFTATRLRSAFVCRSAICRLRLFTAYLFGYRRLWLRLYRAFCLVLIAFLPAVTFCTRLFYTQRYALLHCVTTFTLFALLHTYYPCSLRFLLANVTLRLQSACVTRLLFVVVPPFVPLRFALRLPHAFTYVWFAHTRYRSTVSFYRCVIAFTTHMPAHYCTFVGLLLPFRTAFVAAAAHGLRSRLRGYVVAHTCSTYRLHNLPALFRLFTFGSFVALPLVTTVTVVTRLRFCVGWIYHTGSFFTVCWFRYPVRRLTLLFTRLFSAFTLPHRFRSHFALPFGCDYPTACRIDCSVTHSTGYVTATAFYTFTPTIRSPPDYVTLTLP